MVELVDTRDSKSRSSRSESSSLSGATKNHSIVVYLVLVIIVDSIVFEYQQKEMVEEY